MTITESNPDPCGGVSHLPTAEGPLDYPESPPPVEPVPADSIHWEGKLEPNQPPRRRPARPSRST